MKKSSFLVIFLVALLLGAGFATKDSELVKAYVPVLLEQLQAGESAPEPVLVSEAPKADAKVQAAAKLMLIFLPLPHWMLGRVTVSCCKCRARIY